MRDFLKHRFVTLDKQPSVFTYILKCFIYLFLKDLESEIFEKVLFPLNVYYY